MTTEKFDLPRIVRVDLERVGRWGWRIVPVDEDGWRTGWVPEWVVWGRARAERAARKYLAKQDKARNPEVIAVYPDDMQEAR